MTIKLWTLVLSCVLACAAFVPCAAADEENQMTKLQFSAPVEIPGHVLPAGTYWFMLQSNQSDRNIVMVYSEDWSTLYANVIAIPAYRQQSTDDTQITLAERPSNKPEAVLKWYYPGELAGHEFVYSRPHEKEFQQDTKQIVLTQRP
jgi:hypothetical protein